MSTEEAVEEPLHSMLQLRDSRLFQREMPAAFEQGELLVSAGKPIEEFLARVE